MGEGLIPPEVPQALAMVPGLRRGHTTARETKKVRPTESKIVAATLPHLPQVVRSMVELQLATGMRPGELCIMRPADIDRSSEVWLYQPTQHKNQNREQERIVYIGPRGQDILRPYLLRAGEAFWCYYTIREASEVVVIERGWLNQSILEDGDIPPLNKILGPI